MPLFLLACVFALSVFYIKQTKSPAATVNGSDIVENDRYMEFAKARLELLNSRNQEIASLEEEMAAIKVSNSNSRESLAQIEDIVAKINYLSRLKYVEVFLEDEIMKMGYKDCLVVTSDEENCMISILTDSFDSSKYVDIALITKDKYHEDLNRSDCKVTINIVNSEE